MEKKKPRLELLSESDYEAESESDSESNSSLESFLVRSSSLPSLTLSNPLTGSNGPPLVTRQISHLLPSTTSNVRPSTIPNVFPFIITTTPNVFPYTTPTTPNVFPFTTPTTPNVFPFTTPTTPNVFPLTTPKIFPFTTPANVQPLTIPKTYSAAASQILHPSSLNMAPPAMPNAPFPAIPTVLPFATPTVPPSSISNLSSSAVNSNMPIPSTSKMPSSGPSTLPSTSSAGAAYDGEQLRSSFRTACEELSHDLDIIMQPLKTKQQTLKAIEDYLVALAKNAKQQFTIDLTDDSYTTQVSLKVDKNKVTILPQNTPNQQGEDGQQSEGGASNLPGPSRIVPNSGGACWMPPVNPFTSSVTLRQHLEAASNNVRPRRMRPPPGFHPTPQYNVTNFGASTSGGGGVEGQNGNGVVGTGIGAGTGTGTGTGTGVIRPPPGFHGIAGHGSTVSPGPSNGAVPGPSTSSVPGYYGLLDTQAIIADLYRQSLSVVRESAALSASHLPSINTSNLYASANPPEQLLYSMGPIQIQSERQPSSRGHRESPSPLLSGQYGYGQSQQPQDPMQNASGTRGQELWQHFTDAIAASNSYNIRIGEAGYWDDFLQNEVYNNLTSDQNSDLWKQFEEYQTIQYAPGSLRTGSTIFTSDNVGPSIHGPVGHCRPRGQPRGQRPLENISIQRNFDPLPVPQDQDPRHPTNLDSGQAAASQDPDVLTLSDRFRNAAISNPLNIRPPRNQLQSRNALFGALLQKRLKERAASTFSGTTSANTTTDFPATTATSSSANILNPNTDNNNNNTNDNNNNSIPGQAAVAAAAAATAAAAPIPMATTSTDTNRNNIVPPVYSLTIDQFPCSYCMQNNKSDSSPTHVLRDMFGRTVCPILRSKPCPICNAAGDNAHTVHDCPIRMQWDLDDDKAAKKPPKKS